LWESSQSIPELSVFPIFTHFQVHENPFGYHGSNLTHLGRGCIGSLRQTAKRSQTPLGQELSNE
jgi:hypothetical protein